MWHDEVSGEVTSSTPEGVRGPASAGSEGGIFLPGITQRHGLLDLQAEPDVVLEGSDAGICLKAIYPSRNPTPEGEGPSGVVTTGQSSAAGDDEDSESGGIGLES